MHPDHADLTIGAVSAATGVSVDVLRSWEIRYGFPTPERGGGGHRRYSSEQVMQIQQVQADRRAGISLEAAVDRARQRSQRAEASIFAALRRGWPEQHVQLL